MKFVTIILTIFISVFTVQSSFGQININIPWGKKKTEEKKDDKKKTETNDSNFSVDENNIYRNKYAPADLDYNLKVGDRILWTGNLWTSDIGTITGKKGNVYQFKEKIGSITYTRYVAANAVIPYYDHPSYNYAILYDFPLSAENCQCYNEMYGGKDGLPKIEKKPSSYGHFRLSDKVLPELSEALKIYESLETKFKGQIPHATNTYIPLLEENPAIFFKILEKRVELSKCIARKKVFESIRLPYFKGLIKEFTENPKKAMDDAITLPIGIQFAYSAAYRSEYLSKYAHLNELMTYAGITADTLLDADKETIENFKKLAESVILSSKTRAEDFQFKNPALENLLLSKIKTPTKKVIKSRVTDTDWLIQKNVLGIPILRFKRITALVRDSKSEHPFCQYYVTYINQTYSGGGTFSKNSTVDTPTFQYWGCN